MTDLLTGAVLRSITAQELRAEMETPSPTGSQPGVNPGPGWQLNSRDGGPRPEVLIPDENHGTQIAPYILYDMDTESPEILATRGRGCTVHSRPLRACADPYPRPVFTRKQEFLFSRDEAFTPLVDRALQLEGDLTLIAEVQRYRGAQSRTQRYAARIASLKKDLDDARCDIRDSARHLARANAVNRLEPRVYHHLATDDHIDPQTYAIGHDTI